METMAAVIEIDEIGGRNIASIFDSSTSTHRRKKGWWTTAVTTNRTKQQSTTHSQERHLNHVTCLFTCVVVD